VVLLADLEPPPFVQVFESKVASVIFYVWFTVNPLASPEHSRRQSFDGSTFYRPPIRVFIDMTTSFAANAIPDQTLTGITSHVHDVVSMGIRTALFALHHSSRDKIIAHVWQKAPDVVSHLGPSSTPVCDLHSVEVPIDISRMGAPLL
jgi:hypothetical protein